MKILLIWLVSLTLLTFEGKSALLPLVNSATNISRFGMEPKWSSKSGLIMFSNTNAPGIWVYDRAKGQTRKIHAPGMFPDWNPEGNRIAFWKAGRLWLVNPDGTGALDTGLPIGADIQWSHDGNYIVAHGETYAPADSLKLVETTSWTQRELEFAKFGQRRKVAHFCLTPAGSILFSRPVSAPDWKNNELREYSLTGKWLRSIHLNGIQETPLNMKISPDGEQVVFDLGRRRIYVAKIDGSDVREVSTIGCAADWSPDQKALVFDDSSSSHIVRNGIFILNLSLDLK